MLRQCIEQTGEGWADGTSPVVAMEAVVRARNGGLWTGHERPELTQAATRMRELHRS